MLANDGATVYSIDISGMLVYATRARKTARARRRGGEPTAHRRRAPAGTRGSVAGTIRVAETTAGGRRCWRAPTSS